MVDSVVGTAPLASVDLTIRQGSDTSFAFRYSLTDDDGTVQPTDFAGWTVRAQIRKTAGGALWADLTSGITLATSATALTITCVIPHGVTEQPAWNSYRTAVWDMELVRADGWVIPLAAGTVTVSHDVTRVE